MSGRSSRRATLEPTATDPANANTNTTNIPNNASADAVTISPPTKSRSRPKLVTMERLETYMKPFIEPETYTKYRTIIEKLVLRGERQPEVRIQYRPQLEDLVRNEDGLISLHNDFAKEHNGRFEGKHDRWLLPVYEEAKTGEVKEASLEIEVEKYGEGARDEVIRAKPFVGDERTPTSRPLTPDEIFGTINHIDRPLDADTNIDDIMENSTKADSIVAAEDTMDELGRGAALIRQIEQNTISRQDVEMCDVDNVEPVEGTVPGLSVTNPCPDPSLDARETQSPAYGVEQELLNRNKVQDAEAGCHETTPLDFEQHAIGIKPDLRSALGIFPPSSNVDETDRTKAAITENFETPELVVGFEESEEQTRLRDVTIAVPPHSPMHVSQDEPPSVEQSAINASHPNTKSAPDPYSTLKQSAISYLAWLRQRQTRFPSARPVYSECVAIGKFLGRPPHKTYDEILYHWGLETDSKHGAWYRQHRQEALGEEPMFPDKPLTF